LEERLKKLNGASENLSGKYVLYCMEASQREEFNHALEFAVMMANRYKKPLVVAFFITDRYKFSNARYYRFMLEGILKTKKQITQRGIKFLIRKKTFVEGCMELSKSAVLVVCDKNYLRTQRRWREKLANLLDIPVYVVESDVVVPISLVSDKSIPYAFMYRKKLEGLLENFLKPVERIDPLVRSDHMDLEGLDTEKVDDLLDLLQIDKSVSTVERFYEGGTDQAKRRLRDFIENKLPHYKEKRNDPAYEMTSDLSPYLHFGQVSPIYVALEVLKFYPADDPNVQAFFNELIIWRELARNFCWYNPFYNSYEGLPRWAKETLEDHTKDPREHIYTIEELEFAKTHDPYWNSAQKELLKKGKIHTYMRMYWAKRLIEWTSHPKDAFDIACYLNDKYALDGRDPNGYSSISWCFGNFDRPWPERKVMGKVRYMSPKSLKERFDMSAYIRRVEEL